MKKSVKKPARKTNKRTANTNADMIKNGLASATLGNNIFNPSGLGAQLDQLDTIANNNRYNLISNQRQLLSQFYVEHGLIKRIVSTPIEDGFRKGIIIKTEQLDEDEITKLQNELKYKNDINRLKQAMKWSRLFGGGALLIIDGTDPETELIIDNIKQDDPLEFKALDMWELYYDKQAEEGFEINFNNEDRLEAEVEFYNYYGKKIHKSRVMKIKGIEAPSFIRPRLRGWGVSAVEEIVRSVNQYLKSSNLTFEVMDEFKIDVYRLKGLMNTLFGQGGDEQIKQRVQIANSQKNFLNAIILDSEDEYSQKQLSFAGLAEAQAGIRMQVACDLNMPLTKIFGVSSAGFNSGEDDIENYNSMIESEVRSKAEFHLLNVVKLRCQTLFGFIPDDLMIEFHSLRMMTGEQEENVKTQKFARLIQARSTGEITTLEFRTACNHENLLPIKLDTEAHELNPDDPNIEKLMSEKEDAANQPNNQKSQLGPKKDFTAKPKTETPEAPVAKNSLDYEVAVFEAEHHPLDPKRDILIENPGSVDESLWDKAKEASKKAFGMIKWPFVAWWYKRRGGKFTEL